MNDHLNIVTRQAQEAANHEVNLAKQQIGRAHV